MNASELAVRDVRVICPGYAPVALVPRPRGHFAPLEVCQSVDTVRIEIDAEPAAAQIRLSGHDFAAGEPSHALPLEYGRNAFSPTVTAPDGSARCDLCIRVFRDYPRPAWQCISPAAPWAPRDSMGELVFRDRMWILGGYLPELARDVWSSADGVNWSRSADVPTARGIDIPIAFVFADRMWVADVDGVLFSSSDGEHWDVATADAPWRTRSSAGSVVFDGRIWVMGGSRGGVLLNDVWSSPDGVNWTLETAEAPWCGRQIHHTPLILNDRIWLLGGGLMRSDYHPFIGWNDVWCSPDGRRWEQVCAHAPWRPRIWGGAAVYRDRLWVTGGFRSEPVWENLGDAWYSADGSEWRQYAVPPAIRHSGSRNEPFALSASLWERRHEHAVLTFDDSLWVIGGMVWPLVNDVWRFTSTGLCFTTQPVLEAFPNGLYEYAAHADFHNGPTPPAYALTSAPDWLSVDSATGLLCGTPGASGTSQVSLLARTPAGETAEQTWTLEVLPNG